MVLELLVMIGDPLHSLDNNFLVSPDLKKKDISSVDFTVADVDDGGAHVYIEANNVVTGITVNQ